MKVKKYHVVVKGTYSTIILSMLIFFTKYFFSYMSATDQYLAGYLFVETAIYSLSAGISIGIFSLRLIEFRRLARSKG
jgi:hypothetical protein